MPFLKAFGAWLFRLVAGWIPIGDKPLREWFGKILWVVGIIMTVNFVTDYFRPKPMNNNRPVVIALPFSKVGNVEQSSNQKSEELKRKWWHPIPFVSVGGEVKAMSSSSVEAGPKAEAGLRWDF